MVLVAAGNVGQAEQVRPRARVLVIDAQPLFNAAVARLLSAPPIEAEVHTALVLEGDPQTLLDAYDLMVIGVSQKSTGADLMRRLTARAGRPRVILLADASDIEALIGGLIQGADGAFTKESAYDDFLAGVEAVMRGHRSLSAIPMRELLERAAAPQRGSAGAADGLSPAEQKILAEVGAARSIQEIAAIQGISPKTVRNHLARIYRKLQLSNRTEAMLYAARAGMLPSQQP